MSGRYEQTGRRSLLRSAAVVAVAAATLRLGAQRTVAEQYLSQAMNQERAALGLAPLTWNGTLALAARQHAERMAAAGTLTHQLRDESGLAERVEQAGARFPEISENIGVGLSPVTLHSLLMGSPHHRENILDSHANAVGVAVVASRGQLWVVEDFAFSVTRLPLSEQERRVSALLRTLGMNDIRSTEEARTMCTTSSGFVGERPAFVMRYTATSLRRLPDELLARLSDHGVARAAVGACAPPGSEGAYNIAVVLYR